MSRWHPFILLCQAAEDTAYRDADVVVSMLPKVHEHMASRGLDLRKLAIVPNGITLEEWGCPRAAGRRGWRPRCRRRARPGRTVVGYAGSHGVPNALDTCSTPPRCCATSRCSSCWSATATRSRACSSACGRRAGVCSLLPPIPKAQIPSFLARHRHRLHRLAARADLPLRHRAQQADGLHDGRLRGAACGGGRQRPGGRRRLRPDRAPESAADVADGLRRLAAMRPRSAQRWASAAVPTCWRTTPTRCWPSASCRRWRPR
jgi:hypothetical protein